MTRVLLLCALAIGCGAGPSQPVEVRRGEDACAQCRMTIVSTATAAQIVAPGTEPVIFDEIDCLSRYLSAHPLADAQVFVADHRTGEWVDAGGAVFTRTGTQTPMSSGVLAHANAESRDADDAARGGTPIRPDAVLRPEKGRP